MYLLFIYVYVVYVHTQKCTDYHFLLIFVNHLEM